MVVCAWIEHEHNYNDRLPVRKSNHVARHCILRTVFVESQDPKVGLLQVVLRHRLSDEPRLAMVESDADFT